jgi:hypothetical protein
MEALFLVILKGLAWLSCSVAGLEDCVLKVIAYPYSDSLYVDF